MSPYEELTSRLQASLPLIHRGKVRDTYSLPRQGDHFRLVVVTDRASIFDFELGFTVPRKGEYLHAFNIAARRFLKAHCGQYLQDLVVYGSRIDEYLPSELRKLPELQRRAAVVVTLQMVPVELVVRAYLVGSAYRTYQAGGSVCGHDLATGLREGARFDIPRFTPTTKALTGHDMPLSYQDVVVQYGPEVRRLPVDVFTALRRHAQSRDLLLVDMKLEAGRQREGGPLMLADEVCTPDSSRFWRKKDYDTCYPRRLPQPMDKQMLRDWGCVVGIDRLDPKNPEHVERVRNIPAPADVVESFIAQMDKLFGELWQSFPSFQKEVLGIRD